MIQWHDSAQTSESADGRFLIEEIRPHQWRPIDSLKDYHRIAFPSREEAKAWCEMRVVTPIDYDEVQPDAIVGESL